MKKFNLINKAFFLNILLPSFLITNILAMDSVQIEELKNSEDQVEKKSNLPIHSTNKNDQITNLKKNKMKQICLLGLGLGVCVGIGILGTYFVMNDENQSIAQNVQNAQTLYNAKKSQYDLLLNSYGFASQLPSWCSVQLRCMALPSWLAQGVPFICIECE